MIDAVNEIVFRMGEVRNGIAHNRLDFHFDAVHLTDIKVVEELLYAMRLKELGISDESIKKGIDALFQENAGFDL